MDYNSLLPSLLLASTALTSLSIGILAFTANRYKIYYSLFYIIMLFISTFKFIDALDLCVGTIKMVMNNPNTPIPIINADINIMLNDISYGVIILTISVGVLILFEMIKFYQDNKTDLKTDLLNLIKRMKNRQQK